LRLIRPSLLILAASCAPGDRGATIITRDSTGVQILENHRPVQDDRSAFVDPVPILHIGVVEGDEALQFQYISGVVRLSDGTIVVADRSDEIRWFDSDGRHLRSVGGTGDGPGEFEFIQLLRTLPGDTVLAMSHFGTRFTWLAPDGAVTRIRTITAPVSIRDGLFADGALLASRSAGLVPPGTTGRIQDESVLLALPLTDEHLTTDLGGTPVFEAGATIPTLGDTIVQLSGTEFFRQALDAGGGRIGISNMNAPYGAERHAVAGGDRVYTGNGVEFDVAVYARDGTHVRSVRIAGSRTPLTDEQIAIWENTLRNPGLSAEQLIRIEGVIAEQTYPEYLPAYSALMVDSEDHLWVERYRLRRDDAQRWCIFDPDGRWLAEAVTPAGLEIHAIGADWVLGVWRDENDVEFVRLHRLIR
jgi:hypothetical protein